MVLSTLCFVIFILRISMLSLCHTQSLFWLPWWWTLRSHQPVTVFIRWDSYNWWLTHCGLISPYGDIDQGQQWVQYIACCSLAPIHYLNQCWLPIGVLWYLHDRSSPGNTHGINLLDKFENYILQITADSQALVCISVFVVLFSGSPIIKACLKGSPLPPTVANPCLMFIIWNGWCLLYTTTSKTCFQ